MEQGGVRWLEGLSARGIKPGLDSIRALLDALGDPQKGLRAIHVAGSDGKGSVCCMLESILLAAGYSVGMFTSPHIIAVNECIRLNGKDIDDSTLDEYLDIVKRAAETSGCECTNFEAQTACALKLFRDKDVDIAIIEVGMGGRLDATNVLEPDVTVINGISMEHTQYLGQDLVSIASEKAGIMRSGVPCVTINTGVALDVIREQSERIGCPLITVDPDDVQVIMLARDSTMIRYLCNSYRVGLPGSYQAKNAALAIETVVSLRDAARIMQFVRIGLDEARWPARMQKLEGYPIILDATHTRKGAESLRNDIEAIYGKVILVTAMLNDKDLDGVAYLLSQIADKVLVSSPESPRAAEAESLASYYRKYHDDVTVYGTMGEALESALKENRMVLVTGSFRTAEDCLRWLRTRT